MAVLPLTALLLGAAGAAAAPMRLSLTLGDHMVLQRDAVAPAAHVWGFADAGVSVAASLDGAAPLPAATAGADGVWRVALPPTPAGGPHSFAFKASDGSSAALNDVYFGEVHLCSGQSNMGFVVSQSLNASAELAAANDFPLIRLFTVGQGTTAPAPLLDLATVYYPWAVASNVTLAGSDFNQFSAVCWFYARDLFTGLGGSVPVGAISSNWGGSPLEQWMGADALAQCGSPPPPPLGAPPRAGDGGPLSSMYNAMIAPFGTGPTAIASAIW